ncbi:MAG: hypothetical protein U0174_22725 [Polyangiaceae bacterium]
MKRSFVLLSMLSIIGVSLPTSVGCSAAPDEPETQNLTTGGEVSRGVWGRVLDRTATPADIDAMVDAMARGDDVLTPSEASYETGMFEEALRNLALNPSSRRNVQASGGPGGEGGFVSCYKPRDQAPHSRTKFVNCAAFGTRINRNVKYEGFELRISEECGYIGGCVRGDVDHMGFTVYLPGGGEPIVNNHFSVYVPVPAPFVCEDERLMAGISNVVADVETCQEIKKGGAWKKQKAEILKRITERYNRYVANTFKEFAKRASTQAIKKGAQKAAQSFIETIGSFLRGTMNTFFIIIAIDPATGLPYGLPGQNGMPISSVDPLDGP